MTHVVFIDPFGTFIDPSHPKLEFDQQRLLHFHKMVEELKKEGVTVGLCSDYPVIPLRVLASKIGLARDTPMFAENGNVYFDGQTRHIFVSFPNAHRIHMQEAIREALADEELPEVARLIAPEFADTLGGDLGDSSSDVAVAIDPSTGWGFGAHRESSISMFGPAAYLHKAVGALIRNQMTNSTGVSFDLDVDNNRLTIHPINLFQEGKRRGVATLLKNRDRYRGNFSHVWMVGASASDWMGTIEGAETLFVESPEVTGILATAASYTSDEAGVSGVIDCLGEIGKQVFERTSAMPVPVRARTLADIVNRAEALN